MVDDELEPLITRCPNCSTQFRVTENQLAIASGRVRCGACLTVFQGTEHLILDEEPPFSTGSEADAALDALLDELESDEPLEIESRFEGVHPVAKGEGATRFFGGYEDVALTREIDRIDFENEDEDEAPEPEPGSAENDETDDIAGIRSTAAAPALDGDATDAADGWMRAVTEAPVEPAWTEQGQAAEADFEDEPALPEVEEWPDGDDLVLPDDLAAAEDGVDAASGKREADETAQDDYERWIGRSTTSIDQLVEEVVASGRAAAQSRIGTMSAAAPAAADAAPVERPDRSVVHRPTEISFAPEPRRWWAVGVAALFVVLLLIQIAYLQLPEWSKEPSLRPAYEWACGWLGCELPEMRALDALRTRNLVVRSHPGTSGALIVDAAIVNTAPFAQRFPDLELRFTSVSGELVAGRRFSPDEYLPADFEGERSMPPNTPIQVSLEIVDPGPAAVNYTLSFR